MDRATDLLTTQELAKHLHLSPDTVRAWARRGAIPRLRLSRKAIRYNLDAVIAALTDRATRDGSAAVKAARAERGGQ